MKLQFSLQMLTLHVLCPSLDFYRKLQEDLTDEMVGLARELKERSLLMSQSVKNTEKVSLG